MKFVASRFSKGNKIFPTEINCEEQGLTVKIHGLFRGESQYFDYHQISSVGIDSTFFGYSTITIYTGMHFISVHGFKEREVNEIKQIIHDGKLRNYSEKQKDLRNKKEW